MYPGPYTALNLDPPPSYVCILDLIKSQTLIPSAHLYFLDLIKPYLKRMYPGPYEALNLNHAPNPLLRIVNLVKP